MIFKGTATALITPFTEDDKVDEKALCNIVEHQIASGVNALVALGTTAETATLSEEEKKQIISLCVRQTRGRVPILVGAGSNSTAHAVESCRIAQECGADGLRRGKPAPHADHDAAQRLRHGTDQLHCAESRRG